MNRKSTPIPEPIAQLQRQLDQFRSTQRRADKAAGALMAGGGRTGPATRCVSGRPPVAVGLYGAEETTRVDSLQPKTLSHQRKDTPSRHSWNWSRRIRATVEECVIEFESSGGSKMRIQWKAGRATRLDKSAACLAGNGRMIQISRQMRVLVAIEPVDGRKGIDSLARLCQEKLAEDPFSGCVFVFRSRQRNGDPSYSAMTARDTGWRKSGFRRGDSMVAGGQEPTKPLEAYEAQLLMAAGDVSRVRAAPMWRRVKQLK